MRKSTRVLAFLGAGFALTFANAAFAYSGQEYATQAKITMDRAMTIALKARPGTVTDKELEKEDGGLRYSFDVKSGAATHEVGVDAMTGKVLENSIEGKNPD